jgi:hypothetical protein
VAGLKVGISMLFVVLLAGLILISIINNSYSGKPTFNNCIPRAAGYPCLSAGNPNAPMHGKTHTVLTCNVLDYM